MTRAATDYRLDDVDRRILYELMRDARGSTAASIAERANVSGGTVRNRIENLEDLGVIRGYTAAVDFERAGGKLANLYLCTVPVTEREPLAREARSIPGVVHVRSLLTGRRNLHVEAVGEDTADLERVARRLSQVGIDIEDEQLVEDEHVEPYAPFDPETADDRVTNDVISLTGEANIVEVTVDREAPIVGHSLAEARGRDLIDETTLIIGIERDQTELTPRGDTVVHETDIVTVLTRGETSDDGLEAFRTARPPTPTDSDT